MSLDIVGFEDEVVGEDDEIGAYDIVGAARRAVRGRLPGLAGRRVVQSPPRALERLVCPFPATSIGAGVTVNVSTSPQRPIRIERLVASGAGLLITDVKVGAESQFIAAGSVPIDTFGATAIGTFFKGATATPGMTITASVNNPTGGAVTFAAAVIGPAIVG